MSARCPTGPLGGISIDHWLGVEPGTGRDMFSRILAGLTTSLTVAVLATIISVLVGTVLGLISGFAGGWIDWCISRVMDLLLSFPQILMLLTLSAVLLDAMHDVLHFPAGAPSSIAFLVHRPVGFFGWPFFARIIRGQVLSLREREFIEAARVPGRQDDPALLQGAAPAPVGADPRLLHADPAAEHRGRGGPRASSASASSRRPRPSASILDDSVNYAAAGPGVLPLPGPDVVHPRAGLQPAR